MLDNVGLQQSYGLPYTREFCCWIYTRVSVCTKACKGVSNDLRSQQKEDVQLSIITHKVGCSAIDEPRHLRGSKQAARIGKRGESITHDKFAPILGVNTWEGAPK